MNKPLTVAEKSEYEQLVRSLDFYYIFERIYACDRSKKIAEISNKLKNFESNRKTLTKVKDHANN